MNLSISVNSDVLASQWWRIDRRKKANTVVEPILLTFESAVNPVQLAMFIEIQHGAEDTRFYSYRYFDCVPAAFKPRWWVHTFEPQFIPLVKKGTKRHTIRAERKDHLRHQVGEQISLRQWTGRPYNSAQSVIKESIITRVEHIFITVKPTPEIRLHGLPLPAGEVKKLATADGFDSVESMFQFFASRHKLPVTGELIEWK